MALSTQITSRHLELDDDIIDFIHSKAHSLTSIRSDLVACHVVIEDPHMHRNRGRRYRVRIHLSTPGGMLISDWRSGASAESDTLESALTIAFKAARRQLSSSPRRQHHCRSHRAGRRTRRQRAFREAERAEGMAFMNH